MTRPRLDTCIPAETINNPEFDRWCMTAIDPRNPVGAAMDGGRTPLVTTLLYEICASNDDRFGDAMAMLAMAFEAGRQAERDRRES